MLKEKGTMNVTPDMLERPISEVALGDVASVVSILMQASGITQPVSSANLVPPTILFPPSPCELASQAAFMTYETRTNTTAHDHWYEIWRNAEALCSGT